MIRYLICQKSGISYVVSHNYARIKTDLNDSLPLEKNIGINLYKLAEN